MEIERKFLVTGLPNTAQCKKREIEQGYLSTGYNEIRIRMSVGSGNIAYTLTTKHGSGLMREEIEIPITSYDYKRLRPLCIGIRIEKTRYKYLEYTQDTMFTYTIDVYKNFHLVVVEVEFKTKQAAIDFTPPDWFGKEVTNDRKYCNKNIAKRGI